RVDVDRRRQRSDADHRNRNIHRSPQRRPLLEYDLPDRCDLVQYLIALHLLQRRDHFVPCLLLGKLIIMGFQCLILRPVAALFKAADQPDQRALQQWMIPPPASLSAMSYNTMKVPDRKPLPQK